MNGNDKHEDTGCSSSCDILNLTKNLARKKKWTNKGNDKHEAADSLFHNTCHTHFQNPRCSPWEIFGKNKKLTDTHTFVKEKTKTRFI